MATEYLEFNIRDFFGYLGMPQQNITDEQYRELYELYKIEFGSSLYAKTNYEYKREVLCMWIGRLQYGCVKQILIDKVALIFPRVVDTDNGYKVKCKYSVEDDCFYGKLLVNDLVLIEGETYQDLLKQIPDVVADYERTIQELGRGRDKENVGQRKSNRGSNREDKSVLQTELERVHKSRDVFQEALGTHRFIRADQAIPIILILFVCLCFIFIGWLIPIKSPLEPEPQVKQKIPTKVAPPPKKEIIYEDLNEDGEPEFYQVLPLFEVQE